MDRRSLAGHGLAEMPKTPRSPPNLAHAVDVLAFPGVQLLDVTGPLQVFASANEIVAGAGGGPPYALRVVARDGQGVTASAGLGLVTDPLPPAGAALDTLIVPGGPGVAAATADPALVDWVRERVRRGRRVASVCPGAVLPGSCTPLTLPATSSV